VAELEPPWIGGLVLLSWVRSHCWAWQAWLVDRPEPEPEQPKPITLDWVMVLAARYHGARPNWMLMGLG